MTARALTWLGPLAVAFAIGTMAVGWWAVPALGLAAGLLLPRSARPVATVSLGAALGWGALLIRASRAEGFARLATHLGNLFGAPTAVLVAATILFPMVAAGAAALLASALRQRVVTTMAPPS